MDDLTPGPARFDPALDSWILSTYRDVTAALREPALSISAAGEPDTGAQATLRQAGAEFARGRQDQWRVEMAGMAEQLARRLPVGRPVDLFAEFASPWSLQVAALATGIDSARAAELAPLARQLFLAAATATGPGPESHALDAAIDLAGSLPPTAMAVQGFVALTHTLPHFLVSAWHVLLTNPDRMLQLRHQPELLASAIEELLRYASPSRAVFRVALGDSRIGPTNIARGDRVILLLAAANRDPAQFSQPDRLDFVRGGAGHLAFGKGAHACAGAQLIRLAAAIATGALLSAASAIELQGEVDWIGGLAIRAPGSLPVTLQR